ncbi:hypothetical protein EV175_005049, partial [Coemansia sp. RSA 1933]
MERTQDNSDYALLVPAALQSGSSTPSRLSCNGQAECSESDLPQNHQKPTMVRVEGHGDSNKPLVAFPRPRSSIDGDDSDEVPKETTNGCTDGHAPVDPRLERRRKNQYKRHGSLTLAWQQKMSAEPSARSSRLSSEVIHNSCSSMPATAGVLPLSISAAPYQRALQRHSRVSQAASASSGDIVSMQNSARNSSGNAGIQPSHRWKSGSFTAACVDRLPRHGSIRNGVAGFINAFSSDGRRGSQLNKKAAIDIDNDDDNGSAYCVPIYESNDDVSSTGNLFAPVNTSRASSRVSTSSTEQYAQSSNTHRSLSSFIAYYTQDAATADEADPHH